jgi:hypothetical protein
MDHQILKVAMFAFLLCWGCGGCQFRAVDHPFEGVLARDTFEFLARLANPRSPTKNAHVFFPFSSLGI